MKIIHTAAVLAAVTFALPAYAQTGPRLEANFGWDDVVFSSDGERASKSGVTYGGELGYDIPVGVGQIFGAYAGIDGSSTKECLSEGTERACLKAGRNFTAGVRFGTHIGLNSIVYLKGGYSNGRLEATYTDSAAPAYDFAAGENRSGFHVGAGAQIGLGNGLYGKAEYVYTRYAAEDVGGFDLRVDRHRVLAGVGYQF